MRNARPLPYPRGSRVERSDGPVRSKSTPFRNTHLLYDLVAIQDTSLYPYQVLFTSHSFTRRRDASAAHMCRSGLQADLFQEAVELLVLDLLRLELPLELRADCLEGPLLLHDTVDHVLCHIAVRECGVSLPEMRRRPLLGSPHEIVSAVLLRGRDRQVLLQLLARKL